MRCWLALLATVPLLCAPDGIERPPMAVQAGSLLVRPGGFFEIGNITRSTTTDDDMSSRFGTIPLGNGPMQELVSIRRSRVSLKTEMPVRGGFRVSSYMEGDFMGRAEGQPWRWRQYWGRVEWKGWEVLAGQGWSLLRPNRSGIHSEVELMNTRVADGGYHVGLLGNRDRQIRIVWHQKNWQFGLSYERGRDFVPKVVRDSKKLHLELIGVYGAGKHRGGSVAAVVHATRRIDLVMQAYRARGGGRDALSTLPTTVAMVSGLAGVEFKLTRKLLLFTYAGQVAGGRSEGNRAVSEYTAGFTRDVWSDREKGKTTVSAQFSQITRKTWSGGSGQQALAIVSMRHTFGSQ
ncbi:MAG TPA: hypothetical protein VFQ91_04135 [Bryobacteraceae bacterium]|nr:hypothetical protein [Bryobacteraceae bacterium]